MDSPLRCPSCNGLVVDRRSALCTTCHVELPKEWLLTDAQIQQLEAIDRSARAEHAASMNDLDSAHDPLSLTEIDPDSLP